MSYLTKNTIKLVLELDFSNLEANIEKYKNAVQQIEYVPNLWKNVEQRRKNQNKAGLAYDDDLYKKLIIYFKEENIKDFTDLEDTQFQLICEKVYKNYHTSSVKSLEKFIAMYQQQILEDLAVEDETSLIAPEKKKTIDWEQKLIVISLFCHPISFAQCIYKHQLIPKNQRLDILNLMSPQTPKNAQKLENYLKFYNLYLQKETDKLIHQVCSMKILKGITSEKLIPGLFDPVTKQLQKSLTMETVISTLKSYKNDKTHGAKVCSTTFHKKNTVFYHLIGKTHLLNTEEERYFEKNNVDFSIFINNNKNKLWLGPASYVNHECSPNSKIYTLLGENKVCLQALRDITIDEEITFSYGKNYFADGQCQCISCEDKDTGKLFSEYKPADESTGSSTIEFPFLNMSEIDSYLNLN